MGANKSFYLFKNKKKSGVYYAQFLDPKTGRILHRSTGSKDRDQAAIITAKWLAEGVPTRGKAKKPLAEIMRQDLRNFGISLRKRLAGKTVNNIVLPGRVALRWAFNEKMIPEDITAGLGGYSGDEKKRGILTDGEMEKLRNAVYWENKKAFCAFMLSSTSALRMEECLALRRSYDKNMRLSGIV